MWLPNIRIPPALNTTMPAAAVPSMWLPDIAPEARPWSGPPASSMAAPAARDAPPPGPAATSTTPAGVSTPASSDAMPGRSALPGWEAGPGASSPMLASVLAAISIPIAPSPVDCTAAPHVSRNALFFTTMPLRSAPASISTDGTGAAPPGMHPESRNDRPAITTLLELTTIRDCPVRMAAPGWPVPDVSVSGLPIVRTVSA